MALDFDLAEEQEMVRKMIRTFAEKEIAPVAQELDDQVIDGHIDLYVNDFSISLGDTGRKAIEALEEMARWKKIL